MLLRQLLSDAPGSLAEYELLPRVWMFPQITVNWAAQGGLDHSQRASLCLGFHKAILGTLGIKGEHHHQMPLCWWSWSEHT